MKKYFIKLISFIAVIVIFLCCSISVAAKENEEEFFCFTPNPTKTEYSEGEMIEFYGELTNLTLFNIKNVVVRIDVPETGRYLTGGTLAREHEHITAGESVTDRYMMNENEKVVSVGTVISGISAMLGSLFLFLLYKYNRLCTWFTTVALILTSSFSALPGSLSHLAVRRCEQFLGSSTVKYDGEEYKLDFIVEYDEPEKLDYSIEKLGDVNDSYSCEAYVSAKSDGLSGILFSADINTYTFTGGFFYVNPEAKTVGIIAGDERGYERLAEKNVDISGMESCLMKVSYDSGRIKCWLYSNPKDPEPYPVFDIAYNLTAGETGVLLSRGSRASGFSVGECERAYTGETYVNPVKEALADPYILTYDGVYYLYGTNNSSYGFEVFTSTDLVNWTAKGVVARKESIAGDFGFWAPEVYCYNGKFYMFYTAEEHTAMAVASSPYGPFTSDSDEFFFKDFKAIDSSVFFDDDGRIYMYFSYQTPSDGSQLWGCELLPDLCSYKQDTLTRLTTPSGWEGMINEAPYMLKHNGLYYLTYSGEGFGSIYYGVAFATSETPLGEYKKFGQNPILDSDAFIHGTGHHCFAMSPDGSEMFIIYHCHNNLTTVEKRKICIDRIKFVPTSDGTDILTIYGPTVTPQPVPN